jgi:cyclic pyranopterin phosphate synthase
MEFTHLDKDGSLKMVNVGAKPVMKRYARAGGFIRLKNDTMDAIRKEQIAKGNVLAAARVAGISAAKNTSGLIPLTHNLPLDAVDVSFVFEPDGLRITAEAWCEAKTGVEMEALIACSLAALTIYDMCKAVDREMVIAEIKLLEKRKDAV